MRRRGETVEREANEIGIGSTRAKPSVRISEISTSCLLESTARIVALVRWRSGEDLAEDRPESEYIRMRTDRVDFAASLLGSHVGGSSKHASGERAVGLAARANGAHGALCEVCGRTHPEFAGSGPRGLSESPRSPITLARPQSITWTSPKAPTMTLSGFRSRWTTPRP